MSDPTTPVVDAELVDEWKKAAVPAALALSPPPLGPPVDLAKAAKQDARLAFIRRQDERIRSRATTIMSAALLGADINDDGSPVDPASGVDKHGKPPGWSHRQYRIARDARQPMKVAPGYLGIAQRTLESYQRAEKDVKPAPVLNGDIQVYVRQELAQYVTVNVTERDPK